MPRELFWRLYFTFTTLLSIFFVNSRSPASLTTVGFGARGALEQGARTHRCSHGALRWIGDPSQKSACSVVRSRTSLPPLAGDLMFCCCFRTAFVRLICSSSLTRVGGWRPMQHDAFEDRGWCPGPNDSCWHQKPQPECSLWPVVTLLVMVGSDPLRKKTQVGQTVVTWHKYGLHCYW